MQTGLYVRIDLGCTRSPKVFSFRDRHPEKTLFEWSKSEIMHLNVSEIKKKKIRGKRLTTHPNLRSVGSTTFGLFSLIRQIFNLRA